MRRALEILHAAIRAAVWCADPAPGYVAAVVAVTATTAVDTAIAAAVRTTAALTASAPQLPFSMSFARL